MNTFFFEFLTEEIPARMQRHAAQILRDLLAQELATLRLGYHTIETHVSPRRLVGIVRGLDESQKDETIEARGPRVGAPAQAIEGFLKSQELSSLDACHKLETPKGMFWAVHRKERGRPSRDLLGPLLERILYAFPWPKSMRWGDGKNTWIRPLRSICALFNDQKVSMSWGRGNYEIQSSDGTRGHRFLSPEVFSVSSFENYQEELRKRYVLIDAVERKKVLWEKAQSLADAHGYRVIEDAGLLEEVTGLVEWPVPMLGRIDPAFMRLPVEVLQTSMRVHQRYFTLRAKDKTEGLAPAFLCVANQETPDQGETIRRGNEKVLRARLTDALFFWDHDLRHTLDDYLTRLRTRVFQAKLGSLLQRAERNANLCQSQLGEAILKALGQPSDSNERALLARAGRFSKADLATQMVGEFPELQGIMGSYYALHQKEDPRVAQAIHDHYAPLGPDDTVPTAPFSVAVALADKIDVLYGFFAIGIAPTGSKDPYALRRTALGILRILIDNRIAVSLADLFSYARAAYEKQGLAQHFASHDATCEILEAFLEERLKAKLKDEGFEPDLISAVFTSSWVSNIPALLERLNTLVTFMETQESSGLLSAFRRAHNILKGVEETPPEISSALFENDAERALYQVLETLEKRDERNTENKSLSLYFLAAAAPTLNNFFENVTVNAGNSAIRQNRLALLRKLSQILCIDIDLSKIEKAGRIA